MKFIFTFFLISISGNEDSNNELSPPVVDNQPLEDMRNEVNPVEVHFAEVRNYEVEIHHAEIINIENVIHYAEVVEIPEDNSPLRRRRWG